MYLSGYHEPMGVAYLGFLKRMGTIVLHYWSPAQGFQMLLAALRLNYKNTVAWRTSVSTISTIRLIRPHNFL